MFQDATVKDVLSKRVLIFAHYDKDKIVDDYVIYYLIAFRAIVDKIIFVSDCDLSEIEKSKLNGIADAVIAKRHGEYDFGSYKLGFLYALENSLLSEADECIFANDSCFGPFYPLKPIFDQMESSKIDFWGITENNFKSEEDASGNIKNKHVQSYFLVFNKNVFSSEVFINFMKSIKKEESKQEIIESYEVGLSKILLQNGFKFGSYIGNLYADCFDVTRQKWDDLILNHKMPFLKCYLVRTKNKRFLKNFKYSEIIKKNSNYPVNLITKNIMRMFFSDSLIHQQFFKKSKNFDKK